MLLVFLIAAVGVKVAILSKIGAVFSGWHNGELSQESPFWHKIHVCIPSWVYLSIHPRKFNIPKWCFGICISILGIYIYMCYISGGILLFITCLGLVLTFLPIFDQVLKFTILNSREVVDQPPENNILDLPPTQQQSPFFHFTTQLQTSLELQDVRMRTSSKGIKLKASPPSNSQHHQDCYIEPSFATLTGWWGRSQNIYRCHWIYA